MNAEAACTFDGSGVVSRTAKMFMLHALRRTIFRPSEQGRWRTASVRGERTMNDMSGPRRAQRHKDIEKAATCSQTLAKSAAVFPHADRTLTDVAELAPAIATCAVEIVAERRVSHWLKRAFAALARARSAIRGGLRARRDAAELEKLDDRVLRDIGLCRRVIRGPTRTHLPGFGVTYMAVESYQGPKQHECT